MPPEVASFVQPLDQFQPGRSLYECVAFGVADIYYCGQPGQAPAGNADQVISLAEQWYARETGSNDSSNASGMSTGQEYDMLAGLGLHYEALSGDLLAATRDALASGRPVLICGAEAGFFDVGLGRVPYAWSPSGNHCIVATGVSPRGDLYVRDYANSEFFGYCRQYAASKMNLVSATAVIPKWMIGENMVPTGWKDDGHTLTAPNGHTCRSGFRSKVLAGWEPSDIPTEEEHGAPEGGTMQTFTRTILHWTTQDGITVHPLPAADSTQVATLQATLKQIASLATAAANLT